MELVNLSESEDRIVEEDREEQENRIPFECPEWELDKQSPYLKTFYGTDPEIEQINIDQ